MNFEASVHIRVLADRRVFLCVISEVISERVTLGSGLRDPEVSWSLGFVVRLSRVVGTWADRV